MNEKLDQYLNNFVAYRHVLFPDMFIVVKFLLAIVFVNTNIYVRLWIHPVTFMQSFVLQCRLLIFARWHI